MTRLEARIQQELLTLIDREEDRPLDGATERAEIENMIVELLGEMVDGSDFFDPTPIEPHPAFAGLIAEDDLSWADAAPLALTSSLALLPPPPLDERTPESWQEYVDQFRVEGRRAIETKRSLPVPSPSSKTLMTDTEGGPVYVAHWSSTRANKNSPVFFQNFPGDEDPRLQLYAYLPPGELAWRVFEVSGVFLQAYNSPLLDEGRFGSSSWLGLPESGTEVLHRHATFPFMNDPAIQRALAERGATWMQKFEQGYLIRTADGEVRAYDLQGRPRGQAMPVDGFDAYAPRPNDLDAAEIMEVILAESPRNSPLRPVAQRIAEHMVRESERTGVPAWLMLAQMKFENSLGDLRNVTLAPDEPIYELRSGRPVEVARGSAYNLFGFAGTHPETGRFVATDGGRRFRAYSSYEESITAYADRISSAYRGLTTAQFIEYYFPRAENGDARQLQYLRALQRAALLWGDRAIDEDTILIPRAA